MVNKRLASPNHNYFSTDTDIGSKYTDISVRNSEHTILQGWKHCTLHIRNRLWPHDVTSFQSGISNTLCVLVDNLFYLCVPRVGIRSVPKHCFAYYCKSAWHQKLSWCQNSG